ncbi:DUF2793 domain-containing protein [Frigidibacter albus]|uniref:DUF2793 domain-containing protein n=1 Tax=Frigidibacter albus TaxID=1465486 RepID=A0A6L8VF26_9RHOB|nr:DUF2793 domain-containing protein [Frigidibacter albus]MZQ88311.1 DUF2793 domain-containing protein [Frigidibacter albus]NBE30015.1 DUF2793 domain-containing protein [Frigidibacter albus]GGH46149.1 ribonuclease III [Frigidibacter albus]
MTDTNQLSLPLLRASQAQKHVTMNEALMRLDGLTQLVITSRSVSLPPVTGADGTVYAIPPGAVNAWAGHEGELAIRANGGWVFAMPKAGWQGFILDEGLPAVHDGTGWRGGAATMAPSGAGMSFGVAQIDHVVMAGATSATAILIPSGAVVFGVTARVTTAITGSLSTWQLGNAGAPDRFGSGLGLGEGSWARGVLSAPTAYYEPTGLLLTATGGSFAGGMVRIAAHYAELALPVA